MWEPITSGDPSDEAFVARCLLGAGWVGATRRLSMIDLRVYAAFCSLLRTQLPTAPPDDLTLANADTRTVETTGYQLVDAVFGDEGGEQYRRLMRSLSRLAGATVVVHIVEPDPELAVRRISTGYVSLINGIWLATTELDFRTRQQWGALKGSTSLRAEVGRWSAQQTVAGRTTWLDLDLLRALGSGLSARVWALLEAWASWTARSLDGRTEECAIGLAENARQSLGVAHYERLRDARAALNRAGQRIAAKDPSYELIRCEKRAGWCLVVRRLCGTRARAQARSGAAWRSSGSATNKRQRPERAAVRAAAAESLDSVRSKPV